MALRVCSTQLVLLTSHPAHLSPKCRPFAVRGVMGTVRNSEVPVLLQELTQSLYQGLPAEVITTVPSASPHRRPHRVVHTPSCATGKRRVEEILHRRGHGIGGRLSLDAVVRKDDNVCEARCVRAIQTVNPPPRSVASRCWASRMSTAACTDDADRQTIPT